MARRKHAPVDQLIEGFRDQVSRHVAGKLQAYATEQLRGDLANATRGIPRDAAQAERWARLGLL